MGTMNKVILRGNLVKTPDLRFTNAGTPVVDLRIATNEYHTNREGKKVVETTFTTVVVWGKPAENCAKYLTKGRMVEVEGRLRNRDYVDKTGQKRYVTEVVSQHVDFLGGPRPVQAETPTE